MPKKSDISFSEISKVFILAGFKLEVCNLQFANANLHFAKAQSVNLQMDVFLKCILFVNCLQLPAKLIQH